MNNLGDTSSQENMVDLNVLPERHRKRRIRTIGVLAFLLWAVLLGSLYPAGRNFLLAQQEYASQRAAFTQLKSEVENYQPVGDRLDSLQTEIEEANQKAESLRTTLNQVQYEQAKWSTLLSAVLDSAPQGVEIGNLSQSGAQIEINGISTSYQRVLDFQKNLENRADFPRAQILSIVFVSEEDFSDVPSPVSPNASSYYTYQLTVNSGEEVNQP
jgi:Tfp pilus assembly protein PilN